MGHKKQKKQRAQQTPLEWLVFSLLSFNGWGYADYTSPDDYIDSYIAYKRWKGKPAEAALCEANRDLVLGAVVDLLETTDGPGKTPDEKHYAEFMAFRDRM